MTTDYKGEIYDKLQHIRGSFIQKNMRESPFFGAFASQSFNSDSLPGRLFKGYASGFSTSYASSIRTGLTLATIADKVKYRSNLNRNTYAQIPAGADGVQITPTLPGNTYVDLNLAGLLTDPESPPKLKDDLDNVAMLYSILDDKNYATLVQEGETLELSKYSSPGSVLNYKLDSTTNAYILAGNSASRLDALMASLTGASIATTESIPLGRYITPDRNAITAITNQTTPPAGSADIIVSLSPATASASFETISPPIAIVAPAANQGVSAIYRITGSVKITGTISAGTETPFSLYLRRGNRMEMLSTVATPSASAWTPFTATTSSLTAADAPIQLVLVYKHNKTNSQLLITGFTVTSTVTGVNGIATVFAPETDLFVVRRLLHLYTLISNFYIAMSVYDALFTTGDEPAALKNLLSLTYQNIAEMNRNAIRSGNQPDNSDGVTSIAERVSANSQDFYAIGANINKLGEQTTEKKVVLRDDLQRMATTGIVKERSWRYATATIAISIVIVIGLAIILVVPSSPLVKVTGTAAVCVLAVLLSMAVKKLYAGNVAETFNTDPPGASVYNLASYPGGLAATNKTAMMAYYENAFTKQVSDYLSNTTYLSLLLQSNKAYSNVNFGMKKEERYFADAVDQIDTQSKKVRDTTGLLRLDQITERARMTLALTVLIIVTSSAFAIMLLRLRYPSLIPIVLIVAAILLASSLFFYVMDTNARVRTNGAHRYWQQPDLRVI